MEVEKKLAEVCGKGSEEYGRFARVKFFDFAHRGKGSDSPLNEEERRQFLSGLDEARRILSRCI